MNLLLAISQLILCVVITIFEYKKRSIGMFLWAILLVIFSIPHFIGICMAANIYDKSVLQEASLFFIAFQVLYILSRIIITRKSYKYALIYDEKEDYELKQESTKFNFYRYFRINILVVIIFIIYFWLTFGKIIGLSWGQVYTASISATSLTKKVLEMIKDFNLILYFSVTGLLFVSYKADKKWCSLFIALVILYYTFTTQNRIGILPLIVSIINLFICKYKKVSIKQIIILGTIGIITVYSVYGILIFRHAGSVKNFIDKYDFSGFNKEVINSIVNGDGELGLRNYFYYFINIDNQFPGLGEGATYWRIALMFVPTKLSFGLKPEDFAVTMSSAYTGNMNNTTYSIHPTFLGDAYANYGWYGITLSMLWALIIYFLDQYIYGKEYILKELLITIWGTALIIVGRGSVYNGVYIGIMATIIVNIINIFKNTKIVIK